MEILSVKNLTFRYPKTDKKVLDNLSLTINKGDFVVLTGRTGCGKSTLLKLLKKEISPAGEESGEIFFCGTEKKALSLKESASGIGFVFQDPENQIVTDKVWHELSFYMENLGYSQQKMALRIGELSHYFGITPWFRRDTFHLSGGQKQLLSLASVMTVSPALLLLDEPTSRLDPIAATEFLSTLKRLNTELGTTILLCEHRLEDVLPIADKFAFMDEGKITHFGAPKDVCSILSDTPYLGALPSATSIWAQTDKRGELPLSVKEGRNYLENYFSPKVCPTPAVTNGKTVLSMENAWFRYEKSEDDVIRGASLSVYRGEILSIIGGNGSGKSTALKLLSGVKRPYRGKVFLNGKNIARMKKEELYKNNIICLPQNPLSVFLYDTLTADLGKEGVVLAEKMGMGQLMNAHPHDLSGGELQKAAIIKLLTKKPKILLLDEPTKGLDHFAKEELKDLLIGLKEKTTIVIVTHDVEFASTVSDRCALLFSGEIFPPTHPLSFFAENDFYTTSAGRISRGFFTGAVTTEQVINLCKDEN